MSTILLLLLVICLPFYFPNAVHNIGKAFSDLRQQTYSLECSALVSASANTARPCLRGFYATTSPHNRSLPSSTWICFVYYGSSGVWVVIIGAQVPMPHEISATHVIIAGTRILVAAVIVIWLKAMQHLMQFARGDALRLSKILSSNIWNVHKRRGRQHR